jgi:hypothetical protein
MIGQPQPYFLNLICAGVNVTDAKLGSTAGNFLSGRREGGEREKEREMG